MANGTCKCGKPVVTKRKGKCVGCWRAYMKEYRIRKRLDPKWVETERRRAKTNNKKCRSSEYVESTFKRWLVFKMSCIWRSALKRGILVSIDAHELQALWVKQNGICALTELPMTTRMRCPYGASPDRIDSTKGYETGNIQLVCKAINLAKSNLSDATIRGWIAHLKRV